MKHIKNGFFISVEGIDGSGKSVFCKGLTQLLQDLSYDVVLTREPGGTPLGDRIRELLFDRQTPPTPKAEFLLFAASRAQHAEERIAPALEAGKVVISDRLSDSSLVYQGYVRGLSVDLISTVNEWALGTTVPSCTLYLQIDAQTAFKRITARNLALTSFEETSAHLEKAIEGFETLLAHKPHVITLNATQSPEKVQQDGLTALLPLLAQKIIL